MTDNYIPSEEQWARAEAKDAERNQGLCEVAERMAMRFKSSGKFYRVFMFYDTETSFYASVFYNLDKDIQEAEKTGLKNKIIDAVYEELEKVGRGSRDEINVTFEFDSDENVECNYEGDYFLRLR